MTILISNNTKFSDNFSATLSYIFSFKDMGTLHYFLGMEFLPIKNGLLLSPHKYLQDLLDKSRLIDAKDILTLMSLPTSSSLLNCMALSNVIKYK